MSEVIQRAVCRKHGATYLATGWYIWAGQEWSTAADFFNPLHVSHLRTRCPDVEKYLGLGPGWRFLFHGTHEDVWFDRSLLNVD